MPTTTAPVAAPPSGRDPETPTTSPTISDGGEVVPPTAGTPRCQVAGNGLFGADVGISTEIAFTYQTLVIPSVTVPELNLDILGKVETDMGNEIVARTFPQCSDEVAALISTNKTISRTGEYSKFNSRGRHLVRRMQTTDGGTTSLEGFSTRPRDVVVEGGVYSDVQHCLKAKLFVLCLLPKISILYVCLSSLSLFLSFCATVECVNVEPVFPCYVIQGRVTFFSETVLNPSSQAMVRNAIRDSVENGNLNDADNRILGVFWRDFDDSNNGGGDSGGDNNGGDSGGDGGDSGGDGGDSNPSDGDSNKADTSGGGLATWAYALIGVGGGLVLAMIFLCLRRPNRKAAPQNGPSSSSSNQLLSNSEPSLKNLNPPSMNDGIQEGDGEESVEEEIIMEESEGENSYHSYEEQVEEEEIVETSVGSSSRSSKSRSRSSRSQEVSTSVGGSASDNRTPPSSERSTSKSSNRKGPSPPGSIRDVNSVETPGKSVKPNYEQSHMTLNLQGEMDEASALSGAEYYSQEKVSSGSQPAGSYSIPSVEETSDSAYSSYEEVVEEEYEIEYFEDNPDVHEEDEHHWADDDVVNQTEEALPILAHSAQQGHTSSYNSMRNKWEVRQE
jgi:hypothetical protein